MADPQQESLHTNGSWLVSRTKQVTLVSMLGVDHEEEQHRFNNRQRFN